MPTATRELTRLRLAAQGISTPSDASPADVVRRMLAMQAQDFGGARWSVGLRTPRSTDAQVLAALSAGEIVRSWPMRGTLHFTAPEDLGWMLDIAAIRQASFSAKRRADLGITDEQLSRARLIASEVLSGGTPVRRDVVLAAWESRGIPTTAQRGYHLLWNLAHEKLLLLGPVDGKHPTFVLFDEWITFSRPLSGDEALAELAQRYFSSHGPATVRDLAWWASITLGDARRGVEASTGLVQREFGGQKHHFAEGLEQRASGARTPAVHALPGFDEYLLGYQDRSAALEPAFSARIVPGNNGVFLPTIVVDGAVLGTWKRADAAKRATVTLSPFRPLTARAVAGFGRAMKRYGTFSGKPVDTLAQ